MEANNESSHSLFIRPISCDLAVCSWSQLKKGSWILLIKEKNKKKTKKNV